MKKLALTLITGLLISVSALAQSKIEKRALAQVEKVETTIKLTDDEKEKYLELQKTRLSNQVAIAKEFKKDDKETFKVKAKENRQQFQKDVIKTFGKTRGKEIIKASKVKKK